MKKLLFLKTIKFAPLPVIACVLVILGTAAAVSQLSVFNNVSKPAQGDNGFLAFDKNQQESEQINNSAGNDAGSTNKPTANTDEANNTITTNNNNDINQTSGQSNNDQQIQHANQASGGDEPTTSAGDSNTGSGAPDSGNANGSTGSEDPLPDDPPVNNVPTAPTNATITYYDHDTVTVRASRSTDSDGIARHELLRNGAVVATSTSNANPIFMTDSSPTSGQTYTYAMRAVDSLGAVGPNSNAVSVTIPPQDVTPPSLPTNFRVVQNVPGSVTFAWDSSTDNQTTQGNIWYILTSPLDESEFYTWTRINPYQTYWFDEPGVSHDIYIQAIDEANNVTAKVGPVTFVAQ